MSYSVNREPADPSVIERSVRYAATVATLTDAWAFVMEKLDDPLIGQTPSIKIGPMWSYGASYPEEGLLQFSVVVDGWVDLSTEKSDG